MIFAEDTLSKFKRITGFDIEEYLNDIIDFNADSKQDIIDYYSGFTTSPNRSSFKKLEDLLKKHQIISTSIYNNRSSFDNIADWNLLEIIEDLNGKLNVVNESSKFLRSSITKNNFNPNPEVNIFLKQSQTLERLAKDELGADDPQNDWVALAIRNDLIEEDYTPAGGVLLKATFQNGNSLFISSVVDNINDAEATYGIDIQKKLEFEDNDLKVLSPKETIIQAVVILSELRQNDNPEFPNEGINSRLAVGSNLGSLTYPNLFRQLYNTFSKDDTLKSFAITDVIREQDALFLDFEVQTRSGELVPGTIKL